MLYGFVGLETEALMKRQEGEPEVTELREGCWGEILGVLGGGHWGETFCYLFQTAPGLCLRALYKCTHTFNNNNNSIYLKMGCQKWKLFEDLKSARSWNKLEIPKGISAEPHFLNTSIILNPFTTDLNTGILLGKPVLSRLSNSHSS